LSACKDDDLSTEIGNLNNYESFDEEAFNFFDEELSFGIEDCEMGLDNSILMIGIDYQPPTPALLKLDSNFEVDFSKEINSDGQPIFRTMELIKTTDQNFLYCSRVKENSSYDIDIRKYDSIGNLMWNTSVGSPSADEGALSLTEASDNKIMVLAEDLSYNFVDSSFFLVTLDQNGDLLSNLKIIDPEINKMRRIVYSPIDNSILLLGQYGFSSAYEEYLKVSKYSMDGEKISSKILINESNIFPNSSDLKILDDGNVLVYVSSNDRSNENNPTVHIFKLDYNLEDIWSYDYDDVNVNIVDEIHETSQGGLLILSKSVSLSGEGLDVVLSSLNENFEIEWIKSYGTSSSDQGRRLFIDDMQNITIVGNSNYNTGSEAKFYYFILKTDPQGAPY